jgi:hypothetical protein
MCVAPRAGRKAITVGPPQCANAGVTILFANLAIFVTKAAIQPVTVFHVDPLLFVYSFATAAAAHPNSLSPFARLFCH